MTHRRDRAADVVLVLTIIGGMLSFQALRLDLWRGTGELFVVAQDHNVDSVSVLVILIIPVLPGIFLLTNRRNSLADAIPAWPLAVLLAWGVFVSIVVLNPLSLLLVGFLSVVCFVTWYVRRFGFAYFADLVQILLFVLISVAMVFQLFGLDPRPASTAWYSKLDGIFANATFAGTAAAILALFSLVQLANAPSARRARHTFLRLQLRHFDGVALIVGLVGVVWTQQRTSVIAFAIAAPVIWLRHRYFAAVVLSAVLLAPAFLLGVISEDNLSPLSDGNGPTLSSRAEIWAAGIEGVVERPVIGFGPGVYAVEISVEREIRRPDGRNLCPCLPENGPLQMSLAFGLPGAVLASLVFLLAADAAFGLRGAEAPLIAFFMVGSIAEGHVWGAGTIHSFVFFAVVASVLPSGLGLARRRAGPASAATEALHARG